MRHSILFLSLSVLIIGGCLSCSALQSLPELPPEKLIYSAKVGEFRAICLRAEETSCGLRLTDCVGGLEFLCVGEAVIIRESTLRYLEEQETAVDPEAKTEAY